MMGSAKPYELVIPTYDKGAISTGVVHLGFGAFHRAHQSLFFDRLAQEQGATNWGVVAINLRAEDAALFADATRALPYVLRSVDSDGATQDRLIRIHTSAVDWSQDRARAESHLDDPGVHMVTITVSEAGYYLDGQGNLDTAHEVIRAEMKGGKAQTVFAFLASALRQRMAGCARPITLCCCDNIRSNGDMLRRAFGQYLSACGDDALGDWVERHVTFPNSMVDRITPKPPGVDAEPLEARVGTSLGPTIVAEDFIQWVLEDNFAGDRPSLDQVGVTLTQDVEPYEETKIRVLNGGHTALTYLGALAGFETFDQAFMSKGLRAHFDAFENDEVLPSLPKDLPFDVQAYLATIAKRFRNQHIGDTVERICSDGYAKFPIFIRPTIEACFTRGQVPIHAIHSVASWVVFSRRVLKGIMDFQYHEPNTDRLAAVLASACLDDFVYCELLWGDLARRHPEFKAELEKQIEVVEQSWPA